MKWYQGARVGPKEPATHTEAAPAKMPALDLSSAQSKKRFMTKVVRQYESVFRKAGKSWRRHYKKAHGLIHG